jgi:hypothetical protein
MGQQLPQRFEKLSITKENDGNDNDNRTLIHVPSDLSPKIQTIQMKKEESKVDDEEELKIEDISSQETDKTCFQLILFPK